MLMLADYQQWKNGASNIRETDEFERIWKETVVV
jgi:hypothetical protein